MSIEEMLRICRSIGLPESDIPAEVRATIADYDERRFVVELRPLAVRLGESRTAYYKARERLRIARLAPASLPQPPPS